MRVSTQTIPAVPDSGGGTLTLTPRKLLSSSLISSPFGVTLLVFSRLTPNDMIFMSGVTPNTIP